MLSKPFEKMTRNTLTVADCLDIYDLKIREIARQLQPSFPRSIRIIHNDKFHIGSRIGIQYNSTGELVFELHESSIAITIHLFQSEDYLRNIHLIATLDAVSVFRKCVTETWTYDDTRFMRKEHLPSKFLVANPVLSSAIKEFNADVCFNPHNSRWKPINLRQTMDLILFGSVALDILDRCPELMNNYKFWALMVSGRVSVTFNGNDSVATPT